MFKLIALTIIATASCIMGQTANYCASSLCNNGAAHIACKHSGAFATTCAADRQIIPIEPFIDTIVARHNEYRNTVAAGNLDRFLPAVRMGTMLWDSELARIAELNVKQCAMKHDQCRNTDRFKWSGQNLAWYWSSPAGTPTTAINSGLEGWWMEHKDANMEHINSYRSATPTIGHFTPIVNDRNIRIGCALLRQSKNGGVEFFFACNYAQTNVSNRKIYVSGPTASECTSGKNLRYPALCSEAESIDPNTILRT